MQRYFIELSYNGATFFGWQRQPKQLSVQEEIENAFTKLNSNIPIEVVGCGRTDTGVHANHYVLHVDLQEVQDLNQLIFKLNRILPNSIVIHSIKEISSDFHARFNATSRTYRYFMNSKKDPFKQGVSWTFQQKLDFEAMNNASVLLVGTKDFTSFSKVNTDTKTNICTVYKAIWVEVDSSNFYFEITADRFLRNMVRATVGTLLEVGQGKISSENLIDILDEKDRGAAAISVPAHGLFLWEVTY
jgi:tRNA pseudouridine38-40 synthase